ncbi:MAG: SMP-30/gluconolactonase/LRE family protein [Acidimicrobiales bacterium]|nr:SMP-30/gluconolactonase/LRE family protein [Acidimicrobiales bacterium]
MGDIETLAWGYGLLEGPRVDAEDRLYFADVPNGGVYCRTPDGAITTVIPKRRGVGGIALHADGGLVVSGRDISHVRDGESRQLAKFDALGTNDLFVDAAGRVVVGTLKSNPFDMEGERTPGDCWRIDAPGETVLLYGGIGLTNGIGFSPDGTVIYHADTTANAIVAHDVAADGTCGNRRNLVQRPGFQPDGLAVDEAGVVWVAEFGGGCVSGWTADGSEAGRVVVPAKQITSVCFGGADRRDLYVVTADNSEDKARLGTIFRTRVDVPGVAVPMARI